MYHSEKNEEQLSSPKQVFFVSCQFFRTLHSTIAVPSTMIQWLILSNLILLGIFLMAHANHVALLNYRREKIQDINGTKAPSGLLKLNPHSHPSLFYLGNIPFLTNMSTFTSLILDTAACLSEAFWILADDGETSFVYIGAEVLLVAHWTVGGSRLLLLWRTRLFGGKWFALCVNS